MTCRGPSPAPGCGSDQALVQPARGISRPPEGQPGSKVSMTARLPSTNRSKSDACRPETVRSLASNTATSSVTSRTLTTSFLMERLPGSCGSSGDAAIHPPDRIRDTRSRFRVCIVSSRRDDPTPIRRFCSHEFPGRIDASAIQGGPMRTSRQLFLSGVLALVAAGLLTAAPQSQPAGKLTVTYYYLPG